MSIRLVSWTAFTMFFAGLGLMFVGPLVFNSFTPTLMGVVLVLLSLLEFGLFFFYLTRQQDSLLSRQGVTVDGLVIKQESQSVMAGIHRRVSPLTGFTTYQFRVVGSGQGEQVITHTDNVWVWVQRRYPVGSRIPIRYLPDSPTTCQIA